MTRNIVTAFFSIFLSRAATIISLAVMTPILVRVLGEEQYGQYATVMAVFSLLMILTTAGINSGARKYLAEERSDDHWQDHVFGYYFRLAGVLSLLAAAGFAIAAHTGLVARMFGPELTPYFYLLAGMAILAQFANYIRRSLMGLKLEHISEPINVTFTLTFTVSAIVLAALGFGVAGVIVGRMLAAAVVIVLSTYVVSKHLSLPYLTKATPDEFPRWELFSFNYRSVAYVFLLTSLYHVDVIMLGMYVGSEQVAFYKAALVLAEFLWFAPRALQSMMLQSTSNLWAEGNLERINRIASRVTRYSLLLTVLLAVGIGALAPTFVPWYYKPSFEASVVPLWLLLPGALGFAVARPILSISHAKGDMRMLIAATGGSAVINGALNAVLIPNFGIEGAAVATTIGYGSLPVFQVIAARRLGFEPFADARIGRIAITTLVASVPIVALSASISNTYLALAVVPPVGFLCYAAGALLTGAIELDEVFEILGALPAPVGSTATALQQRLGG